MIKNQTCYKNDKEMKLKVFFIGFLKMFQTSFYDKYKHNTNKAANNYRRDHQ